MSNKGLLVLNAELSGVNSHLFHSLRERGWEVRVADAGLPALQRRSLALQSFHWNRAAWKYEYHRRLGAFARSPAGLAARSAICSTLVRRHARAGDVILTFGSLFSPRFVDWRQPVVTFKDYTVELLRRSGWAHGIPSAELNQWAAAERELCRSVAIAFTASENTRRSMIEDYGVPEDHVEVVGEGLCFDDPPFHVPSRPRALNILFVGKDFERKGGNDLLAAFGRVHAQMPAAVLTIAGPPARHAGRLQDGVRWVGLVKDRDAVRALYENATVFALPSRCEPFGLAFLEAMAFEVPCIGTRRDAMPEIVEDGVTGYLVETGDKAMLADRLLRLLEDQTLAKAMGEAGHARVRARFQWSHVTERMDRRLGQVLDR